MQLGQKSACAFKSIDYQDIESCSYLLPKDLHITLIYVEVKAVCSNVRAAEKGLR